MGLCMACGRGVCEACRVVFRGVVHCAACVREGRRAFALEKEVQARPRGTPSRNFFLAGVIGAVLLFLGALFTIAFDLIILSLGAPNYLFYYPSGYPTLYASQALVTAPLLGLGAILFSAGLIGFYWNYGQVFAAGSVSMLLIAALVYLIPPLAMPSLRAYSSPLYAAAVILWGTSWVLVGVGFLLLPRVLPRERDLLTATGVFWVVSGVLLGTVFGDLLVIGWIPFSLASFLSYRVFAAAPAGTGVAPAQGLAAPLTAVPTAVPLPPPPAIPVGMPSRREAAPPPAYPDFPDAPRR